MSTQADHAKLAEVRADRHQVERNYDHMVEVAQRYRAALERIANAESGYWGRIAHEALRDQNVISGGRA